MTPEQWQRIDALLEQVEGMEPDRAEARVREALATDEEARVAALAALREADSKTRFLRPPTVDQIVGPGDERGLAGKCLGGFELLEPIGQGGMGVVYRAVQQALGREVALKVLHPALLPDARASDRFEREARAAAKLDHAGIARVFAAGREQGLAFLAMELVHGPSLGAELERIVRGEPAQRLPAFSSEEYIRFVIDLLLQAAEALGYAHALGIVHRDIKPDNLLVDAKGLRIVDFGLARDASLPAITREGVRAGTLPYMSPEQLRGEAVLGPTTDVYSLGVVLYELLTLRRPFQGNSGTLPASILAGDHVPLATANPRVSRDLQLVCETAMRREPRDRYADGAAFAADLRSLLLHRAIVAKAPGIGARLVKFARRHAVAIGFVLGAFFALLAGFEYSRHCSHQDALAADCASLRAVADRQPWTDAAELASARRRLLALANVGDLPDDLAAVVASLGPGIDEYCTARLRDADALMQAGLAGRVDEKAFGRFCSPPSERDLGEAIRIRRDVSMIWWDKPEVVQLADIRHTYPKVTLRLAPKIAAIVPGVARVRSQAIDAVRGTLGAPNDLGSLPLTDVPVPPGYWRFTVEVAGYGIAELSRYLVPAKDAYVLDVWLRPDAEVKKGMVAFAAGTLKLDTPRQMGAIQVGDSVGYDAFALDEAESSNDEYLAYLADTGARPPSRWTELGFARGDPRTLPIGDDAAITRWRTLPISGISLAEATAFVEWSGKRLPTHVEMQVALRGAHGLVYPWDGLIDPNDAGRCHVHVSGEPKVSGAAAWFAAHLRLALPVRAIGYRQLPSRLFHGYGNVDEWTESLLVEEQDGMLVPDPWKRLVMGGPWDSLERKQNLASHAHTNTGDAYTRVFTGVRCARRMPE